MVGFCSELYSLFENLEKETVPLRGGGVLQAFKTCWTNYNHISNRKSSDFWSMACWSFLLKAKHVNLATALYDWLRNRKHPDISLSPHPKSCVASTCSCQHHSTTRGLGSILWTRRGKREMTASKTSNSTRYFKQSNHLKLSDCCPNYSGWCEELSPGKHFTSFKCLDHYRVVLKLISGINM